MMNLQTKDSYTILGTRVYTLEQISKFCHIECVKW